MDDGSKIKISVAEWVTPAGEIIEGIGLEPDVEVEISDEDLEEEKDPQFDKALEIMREKSKGIRVIQTIVL